MESKNITVCGAGLVGSLLALYLGQKGHKVQVYERRPDMRKNTLDGGRSINLALSDRGWKALSGVGVGEEVQKMAIPMRRRVMHDQEGNLTYQPYGKDGQAIYSVSRAGLNARLMDLAEKLDNVDFNFNSPCLHIDEDSGVASFGNTGNDDVKEVSGDLVFGADGAFSAVRSTLQKKDRFNYSQEYIDHGYKELSIPPAPGGGHLLEREALHIWPRGNFMLIALPNPDGTFTCTLFLAFEGEHSFENCKTVGEARSFFEEYFPDALALMPDFDKEWEENPTSSLVIVRCYPWVKNDKVALIGDAAHAIVPFYGQGMNCGFEDCTVLNELMEQNGDNWDVILDEYQKSRKPDADAIADLAMRNFVEMRDLTGNKDFLLQKKIEARMANKYPDKWLPLYSMVTFSHIPYATAMKEGQRQDGIMASVMAQDGIEDRWDSQEVEDEILRLLEES